MAITKRKAINTLVKFNNGHAAHHVHEYLVKAATINKAATLTVNDSGLISVTVANSQVVPFYVPPSQQFCAYVGEELDNAVEFTVQLQPLIDKMYGYTTVKVQPKKLMK